jgi:DNA-3-methyladenine glycosylase
MSVIIDPCIFEAQNALYWAPWLLGKLLVRVLPGGQVIRQRITETEAYNGEEDLACHASKGRTARTQVMFLPGGRWYIYLCYGMHEMLNLVVGPQDFPAAVLIRGIENAKGPGRLTKQLAIGRALNTKVAELASGLYLEDPALPVPRQWIRKGPRIGVNYAGPVWSQKPWRYFIDPAWPGLHRSYTDPNGRWQRLSLFQNNP